MEAMATMGLSDIEQVHLLNKNLLSILTVSFFVANVI
jgi:hypothetical protein